MIRRICVVMLLVLAVCVAIRMKGARQSVERQRANNTAAATCRVTPPDKLAPTSSLLDKVDATSEASSFLERWISHRKPALRVGLWPDGTVVLQPGGPGSIEPDGSLVMKFWWWREDGLRGILKIHGKRLDALAPPLRASISDGYGDTGFQSTALIFPTEGCWQVTGEVENTRITFVTQVVRIKERE